MSRSKQLADEFNYLLRGESPVVVFEEAGYRDDMIQTELFWVAEFDDDLDDDFLDYELYRN